MKRESRIRNVPRWVWWLGGVFLLAAITFGVSALSASKGSDDGVGGSAEEQSMALFETANLAMMSGDSTTAIQGYTKALELDPENQPAQSALQQAQQAAAAGAQSGTPGATAGQSGQPGAGPDSGQGQPSEPAQEGTVDDQGKLTPDDPGFSKSQDLTKLLPAAHDGFDLGIPDGIGDVMARSGSPKATGPVSAIVWTVYDKKKPGAAKEHVGTVIKSAYGSNASTAVIDGAQAYFGTDGTRFASAVYVRGNYVFEVIVTAAGTTPDKIRQQTLAALAAFPDRPE